MHDYWTLMKKLIWLRILQGASFVVNKITGTSPITLTNAINSAIISLKQYGKCTQASTPTPSSPVDIKCNNGVLTMVDDELPVGYKRILGFSTNNNAYWEIPDFKMNGSDTLRFSFEATDACNVIGAYSGSASGNNYSLYVGTSSNYLRYKNEAYNSSVSYNTRYDVEITPTGSSGMKVDNTWTAQTFTTPTNLCIGTTSVTASSAKLKGKLYGNIEVVGRAKFIPCERVSDNVLGYYDTVGETFYEQTSGFAGAVSLGYDGSHYQLSVVGTPEVLTVSGANMLNPTTVPNDGKYIAKSNGQVAGTASTWAHSGFIPVEEGKKYYFGYKPFTASAAGMAWYDSSKTYISGKSATEIRNSSQKLTAPSGASFVRFTWSTANGYDTDWRNTVYFCEDGAMTKFEPYVTPQTASVENLFAVGDTKDEQDIISGLLTHKVGIKVFDGTENWELHASASGTYRLDGVFTDLAQNVPILSSLLCTNLFATNTLSTANFTSGMARWAATSDGSVAVLTSGTRLYACFGMSTVEAVKQYLAAQYAAGTPVIVLYPLTQETTETVTGHTLNTTKGTNVVEVTSNVDPVTLEVEYKENR